jgi:hypothetical protein
MTDKTEETTPEEHLKTLEKYLQETTLAVQFCVGLSGNTIKIMGDFAHDMGLAWLRLMEDLGRLIDRQDEIPDPDHPSRLTVIDGEGEG